MPGSWMQILPAEVLARMGVVAGGMLLVGLVLWLFGVKIARLALGLLLGTGGALIGALVVPRLGAEVSMTLGGLMGFCGGVLLGVGLFRFLQAYALAVCLGGAVAGVYFHWHVAPTLPALSGSVQTESNPAVEQSPAVPVSLGKHQAQAIRAASLILELARSIPQQHLKRMSTAGIGTAIAAMLFALGFPRATTTVITALLGSLFMMAGVYLLLQGYRPGWLQWWPGAPGKYVMLAMLTVTGVGIQWRFFLRKTDKGKKLDAGSQQ